MSSVLLRGAISHVPGLLLVGGVTAGAFALHALPVLSAVSPLMLAILGGIAIRNMVGVPATAERGVEISMRVPLRLGIVLLGLQLTPPQPGDHS